MGNSTMTRSQFEALPHHERLNAVRRFKIVADAPAAPRVAGPGEIARSQFDDLAPGAKLDLIRSGLKIVDARPASPPTMDRSANAALGAALLAKIEHDARARADA